MKYLPFILGLLINLLFFTFLPTNVKAEGCEGKQVGASCEYQRINATNCQTCTGTCNGSGISDCKFSGSDSCSTPYACTGPAPIITPPSFTPPPTQSGNIINGVQIPLDLAKTTIQRLIPSQYSFQWIKYQFSLGSGQPLEAAITAAKTSSSGGGNKYSVLVSVAKNTAGIEQLKNPPYTDPPREACPPEGQSGEWTKQYCPWDGELEVNQCEKNCIGYIDANGKPYQECEKYDVKASLRSDNGYVKFRDTMQALGSRLKATNVDAVEVWNEPNLAVEWSSEKLGAVNPENYANFLICGIKGLKAGGYNGKIISAAPSPGAPTDGQNMDDIVFFKAFYDEYYRNNSANPHGDDISAFGWHANVTNMNLDPNNNDQMGFQRFTNILSTIGNKKLWMTEYGWRRAESIAKDNNKAKQLQAQYISQAFQLVQTKFTNNIEAMFVWNFGFTKANPNNADFVLWDIEGSVPQGPLCQPNQQRTTRPDLGDTKYVHDESVADDVNVATVAGVALLPRIITNEVNKNIQNAKDTQVQVTMSFISELLNWLSFITNFFCSLAGKVPILGDYCTPNISLGKKELGTLPPGKNIQQFVTQTKALSLVSTPKGMELIPEDKDCNIGQIKEGSDDVGNQKLNELSETMGTTVGFYGNGMPNFKTLNSDDWEKCMKDRMQTENLNIGNKLFLQDRRTPDLYCRKQVFCKGNYPNGICPFEPTPTP